MKNRVKYPELYTPKHNSEETIRIMNILKNSIITQYLNNGFIELDPYYIDNFKRVEHPFRVINFDNMINANVHQINPFIDHYLISLINDKSSRIDKLLSYYSFFNRDYKTDVDEYPIEYKFNIQQTIFLSDDNIETATDQLVSFVELFNYFIDSYPYLQEKCLKLNTDIYQISLSRLKHKYPTLGIEEALNQIVFAKQIVIIISDNGTLPLTVDKSVLYNNHLCGLYVHDHINNQIVNLAISSICPSKENALNIISKLDDNYLSNTALANVLVESNILGLEINFSKLMMFCLEKYTIDEVLDFYNF